MKKIIFAVLCLLPLTIFSQELVQNIHLSLSRKTEAYQIVEAKKNQVSIFFTDRDKIKAVRFNEQFQVIDSLSAPLPPDDYDDVIGYGIQDNNYISYWASRNSKEIAQQTFDFEQRKVSLKTFHLDLDEEKPIKKITVQDNFYLITLTRGSSILNFYNFQTGNVEKKTLDLTKQRFAGSDNVLTTLWKIFSESRTLEPEFSLQTISNDTPPSLTFSAAKRKIYIDGNTLTFTFDNNKSYTQTLKVNLNDYSFVKGYYKQPEIETSDYRLLDANSFLLKDKIVQMKSNANKMLLSVKELGGKELKTFELNSGEEIPFKNSDIVQENGSVKSTRILDKSNQLLRKINNLFPSLSCYTFNDTIYLTLGGVSEIQDNTAIYGAMVGGVAGAFIGMALSSNYSVNNLNSYQKRKVVYINCLFDSAFNHVEGDLKKLSFDKLRVFADANTDLANQTVFKLNASLYYGGYDKEQKTYSFYKFND